MCVSLFAIAAGDFVQKTVTVTFPPSPGPQTECAMFEITDDEIALEGDECFNVTCEAGMILCQEGMVTIEDDDGKLFLMACSTREFIGFKIMVHWYLLYFLSL